MRLEARLRRLADRFDDRCPSCRDRADVIWHYSREPGDDGPEPWTCDRCGFEQRKLVWEYTTEGEGNGLH